MPMGHAVERRWRRPEPQFFNCLQPQGSGQPAVRRQPGYLLGLLDPAQPEGGIHRPAASGLGEVIPAGDRCQGRQFVPRRFIMNGPGRCRDHPAVGIV